MNCEVPSVKFNSQEEYLRYISDYASVENEHKKFERKLCKTGDDFFDVEGYCSICESKQKFRVDYEHSYKEDGVIVPNFRERLFCTTCGSINRIRCVIQKIRFSITLESIIYITEQVTPIYNWLSSKYPHVVGSEYLDSQCSRGKSLNGIRNEDLTCLSFKNESFTHILSFDTLEHVNDLQKALQEVFRCLKPGGKFIFTVPFSVNSVEHDVCAIVENGVVVHKKPPVFHGNPLSSNGSLVFTIPGWKLFDDLKEIGFAEISVEKVWSSDYGYLGNILIFTAEKGECMADRKIPEHREICTVPFTTVQVHMGGDVFLCCPAWTNYYKIGNIFEQSFDDIWNSDKAILFREMMLRGDYSLCNNRVFCRHFSGNFVTDDKINGFNFSKPVLKYISFAHDNECNLACKMSRKRFTKNSHEIVETLNESIDRVLLPMVDSVEVVNLSGNGDIFFSQHYRKLAKAIALRNKNASFDILTNGMGLTEKNCVELGIIGRISSLSVSIDAASESIYRKIRRGANFSTLEQNLEWFSSQKYKDCEVPKFFNFCVQRTNYTDIPGFIEFSKKYNATPVFTYFRDEKTVDFVKNNILSEDHPEFSSFLDVIHSDSIKDSQHYLDPIYSYIGEKYRIISYDTQRSCKTTNSVLCECSKNIHVNSLDIYEKFFKLNTKIISKLKKSFSIEQTSSICSMLADVRPVRVIINKINKSSMCVVTLPSMLDEAVEFYKNIFEGYSYFPKIVLACSYDEYREVFKNKYFEGFNIVSIQEYLENPVNNLCVFASSINDKFDFVILLRFLDAVGLSSLYIDSEMTKRTCYLFEPKVDFIHNNFEEIHNIFSNINDEESKKIFLGVVMMLETGDPGYLQISRYPQYEHPDCMAELGDTIYEGGPFDGTTTNHFAQLVGDNGQVYTFEPLKKYAELTKTNTLHNSNVHVENLGLWSGQSTFYVEDQAQGTRIQSKKTEGCEECRTIDIDTFCFTEKTQCSLIKLDIEGAEVEAIKGATKTIEQFKPKLQIAIYHSQWIEVPSLILKNFQGYKFYLGHHDSWHWETMLYAVPTYGCLDLNCEVMCNNTRVVETEINDNLDNTNNTSEFYFAYKKYAVRQINFPVNFASYLLRVISPNGFYAQRLLAGGAVDAAWYLTQYPDVAAGNMNPAFHYLVYGWKEGRNPNSWFDTQKYLCENPDVKESGANPLLHYCLHGWREGRSL